MERKEKIMISAIILVAIVAVFYVLTNYITTATGYSIKSDDAESVGECFAESKIVLYTSPSCPSCDRQEQELAESIGGIEVVDCSQNAQRCLVLSQLPAFEHEKSFSYGFKTLDEVRELTDC